MKQIDILLYLLNILNFSFFWLIKTNTAHWANVPSEI